MLTILVDYGILVDADNRIVIMGKSSVQDTKNIKASVNDIDS